MPTEEIRALRSQAERARDLSTMLHHPEASEIFARIASDLDCEIERLVSEAQHNPLTALAAGISVRG